MIPYNDLLVSPKKVYKKFKELIDNYRNNIETKDIFYYEYLLEDIRRTCFWNIYCSSNKICMHEYKNGKKAGQICGAKVFIKTENKLQKYLCSRHCRNYSTKNRVYNKDNVRCNYLRYNGEQCKHKCGKNRSYCYIHINKVNIEQSNIDSNNSNIEMEKEIFLKNLKKRRILYFLRKHNKYKSIKNNYIIFKQNKKLENSKISDFNKIYKYLNKYNNKSTTCNISYDKYIYYNKIKYK